MSFTQRIEVLIKAIEVVSLAAFIEGKLEPLHILWIATMGVTGEAWVFLNDSLGILTWGHAAVVHGRVQSGVYSAWSSPRCSLKNAPHPFHVFFFIVSQQR